MRSWNSKSATTARMGNRSPFHASRSSIQTPPARSTTTASTLTWRPSMPDHSAEDSGRLKRMRYHLGDKSIWRVGYGAVQLAGDGFFGPPRDRDEAIAVLRAAVDAGVDHIDTAQYYGPGVVNELIREALHPYPDDLALVSKVAARRDDSGAVLPYDEPDQLLSGIYDNLTTLGVEQLTAVNLRVLDNAPPDARFVDQLGALVTARDKGLIGGIGIS